jgi:DNA (cytosine-5)-methyltransferase 1
MGDNRLAVAIENHPADSRVRVAEDGIVQTLSGQMGTGGGNVPLVMNERQQALTVGEDTANTLTGTDHKGTQCVFEPRAYGICSYHSHSMTSANPDSGVYEADTSRTLDTSVPDPNKNAGGMAVVALEGNLTRPSHRGAGFREGCSYTLNTVENHAVCYQETVGALCASDFKGIRNQDIGEDKAIVETTGQTACFGNNGHGRWNAEPAMLKASGGDFPGGENLAVEGREAAPARYAVRRLTPTECLRLQGLPDGHLSGVHIAEPTEADIDYWYEAWEENRKALGKTTKPRSRNQVAKWLKDPYSDSAAYRAIGNSLAVPCAMFVLGGIARHAR